MAVDWGFAAQIGGVGFTLVFVVLIVLAVAIWLVGMIINKISTRKKDEESDEKKGD